MHTFIVWLLLLHDSLGHHIVTGMVREADCRTNADELNARAGDKRGLSWTCERQAIER
jgi:hypothetical protein